MIVIAMSIGLMALSLGRKTITRRSKAYDIRVVSRRDRMSEVEVEIIVWTKQKGELHGRHSST